MVDERAKDLLKASFLLCDPPPPLSLPPGKRGEAIKKSFRFGPVNSRGEFSAEKFTLMGLSLRGIEFLDLADCMSTVVGLLSYGTISCTDGGWKGVRDYGGACILGLTMITVYILSIFLLI